MTMFNSRALFIQQAIPTSALKSLMIPDEENQTKMKNPLGIAWKHFIWLFSYIYAIRNCFIQRPI